MNRKLPRIIFDRVQTSTHGGKKKKNPSLISRPFRRPSPPAISERFRCSEPLQPQLAWSSSVRVRISVTRPVPMVLFPSRRVNLCPFSRTIGWRSVSVNEVSSPGMIISWEKEKAETCVSQKTPLNMRDADYWTVWKRLSRIRRPTKCHKHRSSDFKFTCNGWHFNIIIFKSLFLGLQARYLQQKRRRKC